jgi:molybdopterin molybdotransferase
MIAFDDARQLIITASKMITVESICVSAALGRIVAEDIYSTENLPGFDNSAMDGFALCGLGSMIDVGREFMVSGALAAGDAALNISAGACEIMTGAPVPNGFDTVVPVENIKVLERNKLDRPMRIQLLSSVPPHAHIRRRGEDVLAGSLILNAGDCIGASERMLLTGLGVAEIKVRRQPLVALLTTGRELVNDAKQALQPGQIRNSNGPFLADRIHQCGTQLSHQETVGDDTQEFLQALERSLATKADIIISTGAVSMGRYDFVPDALRAIGANIVFHKVAMRPGKPLLFAILPNGTLYFGLPGNPISSAVGFRFFVQLAIHAMQGIATENPIKIRLAHPVHKKSGFTMLQKARVHVDASGQLHVNLLQGQESFRVQPLLHSNAWALLPESSDALAENERIAVFGLQGNGINLTASEDIS